MLNPQALSDTAHSILMADLTKWGNRPSEGHSKALALLVQDFTAMARGELQGRWAYGLPTGSGKSAAVVAWIAAVSKDPEAKDISVAVAASKIEALCEMKRSLIAHGVNADAIALIHSFKHDPERARKGLAGYATEPSDKGMDRRFVLVSHSRVQGVSHDFMKHRGHRRDILIWDESLITSEAIGLSVSEIRGAIGWLSGKFSDSLKHAELVKYSVTLREFICGALASIPADADSKIITIPDHPSIGEWLSLVPTVDVAASLLSLFELAGKPARLVKAGGNGLLSYQLSVPSDISNIIILDASFPIRQLEKLDPTISDGASRHEGLLEILQNLKSFNRVTINQMKRPGGRNSMSAEFKTKLHCKGIVKSIVDVVKAIPESESILIFVYKTRNSAPFIDFKKVLIDYLEREGIDTNAPAVQPEGLQFESPRKRINILTWGNECGLNSMAHCRHVILGGILHRSHVDLQASVVGQTNDLTAEIPYTLLKSVHIGERVHLAYQALSRGSCRVVDQGEAARMEAWIIEKSPDFQAALAEVMPGAKWENWDDGETDKTKTAQVASAIVSFLQKSNCKAKLSLSAIRKALSLQAKEKTFTLGIDKALKNCPGWIRQGRSLAKLSFAAG